MLVLAVLEFGLELAFAFALLRKIHRNAPRLVLREQLGRRSQRRALAALFASKRHLTLSEKRLWWADFHGPPHSTSASADLSLSPLKGRCGSPAVGDARRGLSLTETRSQRGNRVVTNRHIGHRAI